MLGKDSKGNYRKYYYDTTGHQIKVEYYDENNVITLSSEYEYDELNDPPKMVYRSTLR